MPKWICVYAIVPLENCGKIHSSQQAALQSRTCRKRKGRTRLAVPLLFHDGTGSRAKGPKIKLVYSSGGPMKLRKGSKGKGKRNRKP